MKSEMTWEERREMHLNKSFEHMATAREALTRFMESRNASDWAQYKAEYKLHNKHWGIAEAMFTRRYGKIIEKQLMT